MDDERRIPPFAEETLEALREYVAASQSDFTLQEAAEKLADDERFTQIDAEEALEILENRGYIYYVDDRVRITSDE